MNKIFLIITVIVSTLLITLFLIVPAYLYSQPDDLRTINYTCVMGIKPMAFSAYRTYDNGTHTIDMDSCMWEKNKLEPIVDAMPTPVNGQITDSVSHIEEAPIQLLFIQTAGSGTISSDGDNYSMTLNDIAAKTVYFSDRPYRIVDYFTTQFFVDNWDEGDDSFAMNPPNAATVLLDDESESIVVVELTNPVYDSEMNTLQYSIKILDDSTPSEIFDRVVLYIDNFRVVSKRIIENDSSNQDDMAQQFTGLPMDSVIGSPLDAFANIKTPGVYIEYYEKVLRSQIPN